MGLAAAVPSAQATPITPGTTVAPSAGSAPATAAIAGPTTTTMTFMSGGATYNLELTSAVYRGKRSGSGWSDVRLDSSR